MPTAERESLFAQVRTDLLAINGTGSYTNTVRSVSRDIRTIEQLGTYPAIDMVEEDETEERTASSARRFYYAGLSLLCYYQNTTPGTALSTTGNSLYRDVMLAMTSPTTYQHGGYAIRTVYRGVDWVNVSGVGIPGMVMRFDLLYTNTWTAP